MASSSNNFPNSANPNPKLNDSQMASDPINNSPPHIVDPDAALSQSEYLTRREVLSRRSRKLHELTNIYKDQYWAMMEELKNQFGEYYWEYGKSPFVEDEDGVENNGNANVNAEGENNNNNNNNLEIGEGEEDGDKGAAKGSGSGVLLNNRCAVQGCKMKAMPLTQYCHMHILRDEKQVLYKGCTYVIKSSQAGPILCGKPILRTAVPSLCTPHMQKAEKHVARALKKAGLSGHSTSKLAPQFHVIVAEFVNQIQAKRRAARDVKKEPGEVKEPCEVNEDDDISL